MSRKTFTTAQRTSIAENHNVSRCGPNSIRYTKQFKLKALQQYNEDGLGAAEIFEAAGLDPGIIGTRTPSRLMNQWNTALWPGRERAMPLHQTKMANKRMGRGRELRHLKAKVAYLEAENDFLAQLRAGKRK